METILIFVLRGVFNLVQFHHCHRIEAISPEIKFEGKTSVDRFSWLHIS